MFAAIQAKPIIYHKHHRVSWHHTIKNMWLFRKFDSNREVQRNIPKSNLLRRKSRPWYMPTWLKYDICDYKITQISFTPPFVVHVIWENIIAYFLFSLFIILLVFHIKHVLVLSFQSVSFQIYYNLYFGDNPILGTPMFWQVLANNLTLKIKLSLHCAFRGRKVVFAILCSGKCC